MTSDTKAVEDMKGNRLLLFTSDWAVRWAETIRTAEAAGETAARAERPQAAMKYKAPRIERTTGKIPRPQNRTLPTIQRLPQKYPQRTISFWKQRARTSRICKATKPP